jgi:hypothetical protein
MGNIASHNIISYFTITFLSIHISSLIHIITVYLNPAIRLIDIFSCTRLLLNVNNHVYVPTLTRDHVHL